MNCYVEFVLIDNITINYILLCSSLKICRQPYLRWRLFLSATIGACFAIILPLVFLPLWALIIIKTLCGILIIYISAAYKNIKSLTLCACAFFLLTFLLGGLIIAIFFMLKVDYFFDLSLVYKSKIPMGLIIFAAIFTYLITLKITKSLYLKKNVHKFIYKCRIFLNDETLDILGFLDSGNRLYYKDMPIHILSQTALSALFKDGLFSGQTKAFYTDFNTISGNGRLLCFKANKLEIYNGGGVNILYNIVLGVSPYHIKGEEYDLILHPSVF